MRRTLLLTHTKKDIYERMFRYFSLQGYEITEQVHNQKLIVKIGRNIFYWIGGVVLTILLVLLFVGIINILSTGGNADRPILISVFLVLLDLSWWIWARSGRISINLEESPEGVYVVANLKGIKSREAFNHLVGILSMLPAETPNK